MSAPSLCARVYEVGPKREYRQLHQVFENNDLQPGDVVEVDGDATYEGGILVGDGGSATQPVTIRWRREGGGKRPLLKGGEYFTIKFSYSNHVVLEGFEITGGGSSCIFSEADDVTVRDVIIRDCPGQGILAADQNSGSFTLEYSEIRNSGGGMSAHAIYMQSDEVAYPGAVFRMRFNYVHAGKGGNLVKVRHERSQIHYNWLEGATYQALELIGPDCWAQQKGWSTALRREDADVVGNVIVQSGQWPNAIRIGGDLNGRSEGRVRLLANSIVFTRPGPANAVLVQLGAGALDMHDNLLYQIGGTPTPVRENLVDDTPEPCSPQQVAPWSDGRKIAGSHNWVQQAVLQPREWTQTLRGAEPGLADAAHGGLRPTAVSPLRGKGAGTPTSPPGFVVPSALPRALYEPPLRRKMEPGQERRRSDNPQAPDIGALAAMANAGQAQ
ncbi:MAG: right-handed parallel beta-helix repeat-containing protein [Pseudoxanthomonas sp.]